MFQDSDLCDSFLDPSLSLVNDESVQPHHTNDTFGENMNSEDKRTDLETKLMDNVENGECGRSGFTLPPLDQKVPEDWETMEGEQRLIYKVKCFFNALQQNILLLAAVGNI